MANERQSVAYDRLKTFLQNIKKAKNEEQIMEAGIKLVDSYSGFHYSRVSHKASEVAKFIAEENKKKTHGRTRKMAAN